MADLRTYKLENEVIEWIDAMYEENPDKKKWEIVNRAIKVYAAQLANGNWEDPKLQGDDIDQRFRREMR